MTFEELEIAVKGGWTVYYRGEHKGLVVTEEKYNFSFPYSGYAVQWENGSLSYITAWEGKDDNFFVEE